MGMNLVDIMLSESQTEKGIYFFLLIMCRIYKKKEVKLKETEKWLAGAGVGGNRERRVTGF